MKYMGLMHYFLLLEVWQGDGEIFVYWGKYASEILHIFHMENCNPMDTPLAINWRKENATLGEEFDATIYRPLVGYLMYLVNTRPDMCYALNPLSQAMVRPTMLYWKASNHVLWYLRGTTKYGLWYRRTKGVKLQGFIDAYFAWIPPNRKSTSGAIFSVGSTCISRYNMKQRPVVLNLAEV